jgi:hypothetical protein
MPHPGWPGSRIFQYIRGIRDLTPVFRAADNLAAGDKLKTGNGTPVRN